MLINKNGLFEKMIGVINIGDYIRQYPKSFLLFDL